MTILSPEEHDVKREPISRLMKWFRKIGKVMQDYPDLPSHARIKGVPYTAGEVLAEVIRRAEPKTK